MYLKEFRERLNLTQNELSLKLDKSIIKKGLLKVWEEARYDKDFDYIDFTELCVKYGFDVDEVVGSHTSTQIQFKKQLIDNFKYQLELII